MGKLIKLRDEFYQADNVAGIIGERVITCDNPQLHHIQGDPAFVSILPTPFLDGTHCEFCHSAIGGNVCYSCGAVYEALNGT